MASPFWVTMEKITAGNKQPDTGLAMTIRVSPYSTDAYTLTEIGTTGVYVNTAVAGGLYRIYKGGVYQSDYGTVKHTDEDEEQYILTAGTRAFSGDQSMGTNKLTNLLCTAPAGTDAINKDWATSNLVLLSEKLFLFAGNVLLVDYAATDSAGARYNTIQEAIDYAAGTGTAGPTNRWTVYITPPKDTSSYQGYNESVTLKKYIDLIGIGRTMLKVVFGYSGTWTGGTYARLDNLVIKPAVDTNLTLRGLECSNCHFLIEEDSLTPTIALENSQFDRCGFWQKGTPAVTTLITSSNNNVLINPVSNDDITSMVASDIIIGDLAIYDDPSTYFKLT